MAQTLKAKLKKGLIACGYAMLTESEETGAITYADVIWLPSIVAGSREYSAEPRGEMTSVYADSRIVHADNDNDGYDITLTLLNICDNVETDWLNHVAKSNGMAEYADSGEFSRFALILVENTTDGVGKTTIFYDCRCSKRPSLSGKTKEGSGFEYAFAEYALVSSPRPTDALVKFVVDGKTKVTSVTEPTDGEV